MEANFMTNNIDNKIKFTGIEKPYEVGKYGVLDNAKKLLRYVYFHQKLTLIGAGHLPARADWELKHGIGRHLYEDAETATALRKRVVELRTSKAQLGKASDPSMELFFSELIHVSSDLEYATLIYGFIKPKLLQIYRSHIQETQQIVDQPTIRMFKQIILDLEQQVEWGQLMIKHLKMKDTLTEEQEKFIAYLMNIEHLSGGFDGSGERSLDYPSKNRSHVPYCLPKNAVRDSSMGPCVNYRSVEDLKFESPDQEFAIGAMFIRQQEMVAAEMIAGVIYEQSDDMPWEFYAELARHVYDEIRHSMFGQAALEVEGYEWRSRPQYVGEYDMLLMKVPAMRYALLAVGYEDWAMKRPGKVAEYEHFRDVIKRPLLTQFQDYDFADEVIHGSFGRKWGPILFDEDLETVREMTVEPFKALMSEIASSKVDPSKEIIFRK
jgi:hypothetical protein